MNWRYLLEAQARLYIPILQQGRDFISVNRTWSADFTDPQGALLASILVPLLLLLAGLAAALAWRTRTTWKLRHVPRVRKSQLHYDEVGLGSSLRLNELFWLVGRAAGSWALCGSLQGAPGGPKRRPESPEGPQEPR